MWCTVILVSKIHQAIMAKKLSRGVTFQRIANLRFSLGLALASIAVVGVFFSFGVSKKLFSIEAQAVTRSTQCNPGAKTCQGSGGTTGNTGFQCVCTSLGAWSCTTKNLSACPVGAATPTSVPSTAKCTAANGTKYSPGQGVCTTLSGKTTGDYCTCIDLSTKTEAKAVWQCGMNTQKCAIQVIDPAYITNPQNAVVAPACKDISGLSMAGSCLSYSGKNISKFHCPNGTSASSSSGCSDNGTIIPNKACFDVVCGVQQLDIQVNGVNCYKSIYVPCSSTPTPTKTTTTPTPTKTPTPTPPIPTKTPTPSLTPVLVCRAMRAFDRNNLDITAKLSTIKMGDKVTFRGYADNTQKAVSMTFVATLDGKEVLRSVVPVSLVGNTWQAAYTYHFTKLGNHSVKIISINK